LAAVPGVTHDPAQDAAFAIEHRQYRGEFRLIEQQALVADARINQFFDASAGYPLRVAHGGDDAFARTHAPLHPFDRPNGIGQLEDGANAIGRRAFARLGSITCQ
jgi:hypothetical protein